MNKKAVLIIGLIILAGVGILIYRNSLQQDQFSSAISKAQGSLPVSPDSVVNVEMINYSFQPEVAKVKKGTKVIWTNRDFTTHTVTGYSGVPLGSSELNQGHTFEQTFDKTGIYRYHCTPHPFMTGAVIVE